jgi:sugar fermentation stimulation protein A
MQVHFVLEVELMKLNRNTRVAKFKERPNRFLAKVILKDKNKEENMILTHVPDPGRLKELLIPGADVIIRESLNQNRKTKFSLIGVKYGDIWVNIDSILTNRLFKEEYQKIKIFKNYEIIRSEFTFRKSRLDFLMRNKENLKPALVEIKSVTLVQSGQALFPDAPTVRGTRHVKELTEAIKQNYQSFIVFIIKRSDAYTFTPNKKIDIKFAETLSNANKQGVQISAVKCSYDPIIKNEINILTEIPLILE